MKFLSNLLMLLVLGTMLSSCINVNDEVWIEADGSGRYESTSDLGNLLPFMAMGLQQEMEKAEQEDGAEENPMLGFMKLAMQGQEVDTTFGFRSMIDDAMAQEGKDFEMLMDSLETMPLEGDMTEAQRERLLGVFNMLGDMEFRMRINQATSLFKTTNIQRFSSLNELSSLGEAFREMAEIMDDEEGGSPFSAPGGEEIIEQIFGSQTLLDIDGDVLRIRRAGFDMAAMGEEVAQNMAMIKMFLGDQPYRMTIHLPGKVKKISSELVKKVDKNTVMLEIPLDDLLDPELRVDATVKFKGLK